MLSSPGSPSGEGLQRPAAHPPESTAGEPIGTGADESASPAATWDAGDMGCGELIVLLRGRVRALEPGQILELIALDTGAIEDIPAWCRLTGHALAHAEHPRYLIRRKEG